MNREDSKLPFEWTAADDRLGAMLRAQPEPMPASNLAHRAMMLGKARVEESAKLARFARLQRVLTAIAAVLILAIGGWIFRSHKAEGGFQPWSDTGVSETSTTVSSTDTGSSNSNGSEWMLVGTVLVVASVAVVTASKALGDERTPLAYS